MLAMSVPSRFAKRLHGAKQHRFIYRLAQDGVEAGRMRAVDPSLIEDAADEDGLAGPAGRPQVLEELDGVPLRHRQIRDEVGSAQRQGIRRQPNRMGV